VDRAQTRRGEEADVAGRSRGTHSHQQDQPWWARPSLVLLRPAAAGYGLGLATARGSWPRMGTGASSGNLNGVAGSEACDHAKRPTPIRSSGRKPAELNSRLPAASRHMIPAEGCDTCFDSARSPWRRPRLVNSHGRFIGLVPGAISEGRAIA